VSCPSAPARGLALVIVRPIPGQEEQNADRLLAAGAATRNSNLDSTTGAVWQRHERAPGSSLGPQPARDIAATLIG